MTDLAVRQAALALSAFDPLAALQIVALRDDAPSLALRGIAMAQLGDFVKARKLLGRAAAHPDALPLERARAIAAEAEVLLAARELAGARKGLEAAIRLLDAEGDRDNALFVRVQLARQLTLVGDLTAARRHFQKMDLRGAAARVVAASALGHAELAVRDEHAREARSLLRRALAAARLSRIPFLVQEVERTARALGEPIARIRRAGAERLATLEDVESVKQSGELLVDARRREVRRAEDVVVLAKRPVLFALARYLGEAAPGDVAREALIEQVFGAKRTNESHRVRLRVEIGRLRTALAALAKVDATARGFALTPVGAPATTVLLPAVDGDGGALLALLADGEAWSTSALAAALGRTQRGVQRWLAALVEGGSVQSVGRGRTQRWVRAVPNAFATPLLLVESEEPR